MILSSHGSGSNLLEHLREVMRAAETPEERIIYACHDFAKATEPWQKYISGKRSSSPHKHAAAGGILSMLLILRLNGADAEIWALAALHAAGAHHSDLQSFNDDLMGNLSLIAMDSQVREFLLDRTEGICSLLPEVPYEVFCKAWNDFVEFAPTISPKRDLLNLVFKQLSGEKRIKAYLMASSILGRLCLFDHQSAAKQQNKRTSIIASWRSAFPLKDFKLRSKRAFHDSKISFLRTQLCEKFLKTVDKESIFYFIDAPTGLGKTEAMLCAAEKIRSRLHYHKIVFAVPQVSIADQIYADYLKDGSAQIWNYRRKENRNNPVSVPIAEETVGESASDAEALEQEMHPFSESYNVVTFNQVLLSMCHPNRHRCLRGLGLSDAVIIMDEFHKLPMEILPLFFRIAREFAKRNRCRFILGSATPLNPFDYWDLSDSPRISETDTLPLYNAPEIDHRRLYASLGELTIEEVGDRIEEFHAQSTQNLLVVLNLIGKGTWPLLQRFRGVFDPWAQLDELGSDSTERIIIWLDGLVPPMLREQLIVTCRKAMKKRPVTLITTQMVEVGVDLDFDHALIDYQGIAATIQRGGRVGRNGRSESCRVEVFSLRDRDGNTSFGNLLKYQKDNNFRLKLSVFSNIYENVAYFYGKEEKFFKKWEGEKKDSDLTQTLSKYQTTIFGTLSGEDLLERLFSFDLSLGANFQNAQFIAELFQNENQEAIVLVESLEIFADLDILSGKVGRNCSTEEERKKLIQMVAGRTITPSSSILSELKALLEKIGVISYPEELSVYRIFSGVL